MFMKKYFLIIIASFLSQALFSQSTKRVEAIRHDIDSLKRVLPDLSGIDKVDCLNTLAHKYLWLPLTEKQQIDSSSPYSIEANREAKRIGYKRGLGFSYLRLAGYKTMEADSNFVPWKKIDTASINTAEKYLRQVIQLGEDLKDNVLLGGAYWDLGYLTEMRYWNDSIGWNKGLKEEESYIRKAISYHEKDGAEMRQGNFREQGFVNCEGCVGNERWLGGLYNNLSKIYNQRRDYEMARKYGEASIPYYKKAGETELLGNTYRSLAYFCSLKNDYAAQEQFLKKAIDCFQKEGITKNSGALFPQLANIYRKKNDFIAQEEILKQGISFIQNAGDEEAENNMCISLTWFYISNGEFEKGFPFCEKSIKLSEKLASGSVKKQAIWGTPYFYLSRLYKYAGDYETALFYLYKCKKWYDLMGPVGNATAEIGDIHRIMKNYDSAMFYLKPFDTVKRSSSTAYGISNLGNLFNDLKEYDKAIPLIKESIKIAEKTTNSPGGFNYTALGKAYLGKKIYQEALKSAREAQSLLRIEVHKIRMMENYELLSQIFYAIGRNDSAYYYLRQYTTLKDSLLTRQFYWRLNNYKKVADDEKKTSQINLLNKDNQLKNQKLKQEAFVKNTLIAGLVILFLLGIFVFRTLILKRKNEKLRLQNDLEVQRLESEKQHSELRQQATELEMQALRAQMNPHFIFNCLSSINRFIIKNETETASDYLTRFSRLIRMVLINSQRSLITLEDELETLRLYLDMERLRFKNSFDYNIIYTNTVDAGAIFIPPLLLQPFCENAIWHGLMHKEGPGTLDIAMNIQDKVLNCTITDNGVGREKAAELRSRSAEKEKSLGLKITKERLALFNKNNGSETFYEIEDLYDKNKQAAGTKVKLQIVYRDMVEELP